MENTVTHHNWVQRARGCCLQAGLEGVCGSCLVLASVGFLNTHLAAGEVLGANSAEPSNWTYNSALARPGWAHRVFLVLSPGLGCSIRLEASWSCWPLPHPFVLVVEKLS